MSQLNAAALPFTVDAIHAAGLVGDTIPTISGEAAAAALMSLETETSCAVTLLRSFRDKTSSNPKGDLTIAFAHIDRALVHNRMLQANVDLRSERDISLLHKSMQYFHAVLSDVPQVSFVNNAMIDSLIEIKDALHKTRQRLEAVEV